MSGYFFFDPLATAARPADAGGIDALRLLEFSLPPADRRTTQPGDGGQPFDPSPTVDRRPEASEQSAGLLVEGGDQEIDGPMLLNDRVPQTLLTIGTTTDTDSPERGRGLHSSPLPFGR